MKDKLELLRALVPCLERCACSTVEEKDWVELQALCEPKDHVRLVPRGMLREITEAAETKNKFAAAWAFCNLLTAIAWDGPRLALHEVRGLATVGFMH